VSRPEELEHAGVLERGGVRHVDDDRCALEDVVQSVAAERVDALQRRRRS
jgi:hypothetical protein